MKYAVTLFSIVIVLYACSSKQEKMQIEKPDLEMDVINDILPLLIPEHPPCRPVPIEDEEPEEYDKRLKAFYERVDSVGKKIEFVSLLTKFDSTFIQFYKQFEKESFIPHLLNAPPADRRIASSKIRKIEDVKIVLVRNPRSNLGGGLTDCYTLGQFTISRVGFNADSTRAVFRYFC